MLFGQKWHETAVLVSFLIFSKEKKMPRKDAKNVIHASCIQWMKEGPSGFFLEKEEN